MSETEDALTLAHEALRRARVLEDHGRPAAAEEQYEWAERYYEEAGVDATWFDDADLAGTLDEPPAPYPMGVDPIQGAVALVPDDLDNGSVLDPDEDQCIVASITDVVIDRDALEDDRPR